MPANKPSDQAMSVTFMTDADLEQIAAGNGPSSELSCYDKRDLESLIKRASAGGPQWQQFVNELTSELESRSPDEPYVKPIILDD